MRWDEHETINKPRNPTSAAADAPQSKRYDETFKREAVEHCPRGSKSGGVIANELGVSTPMLKAWKRVYAGESVPGRPRLGEEPNGAR